MFNYRARDKNIFSLFLINCIHVKQIFVTFVITNVFKILILMDETVKSSGKRYFGLNKYQIGVLILLVAMLFFFSDNSVFKRLKNEGEISDLKKQIEHYRQQTETDKARLHELKSDKDNLEKFARENYMMKKENEEVFIIE